MKKLGSLLVGCAVAASGAAVLTATAAHADPCPTVETGPVIGLVGCPVTATVDPSGSRVFATFPMGTAFVELDGTAVVGGVISTPAAVFVDGHGPDVYQRTPAGATLLDTREPSLHYFGPAGDARVIASPTDKQAAANLASGGYVGVTTNDGVIFCATGRYDYDENTEGSEDPGDPYEDEPNTVIGIPPAGPPTVPTGSCAPAVP